MLKLPPEMTVKAKIGVATLALLGALATSAQSDGSHWRFIEENGAGIAYITGKKGAVLEYRCSRAGYENTVTWWDQFETVKGKQVPSQTPDSLQCGVVLKTPDGGCLSNGLQVVDIRSYPFHMIGEFGCRRHRDGTDYTFFNTTEERLRKPLMNGHYIHFDVGEKYSFRLKGSHRAIRAARSIRP